MENTSYKVIGIMLIIIPLIAILTYVIDIIKQPVPIMGSPFVAIILWIIGAYLISYKPKKNKKPQ